MTDQAALLAAIFAAPDDDAPRLVYADWLDEHAGSIPCDWCHGTGEDRPPPPIDTPQGRMVYRGPLGPCPKCNGARGLSDGNRERAAFIRHQINFRFNGHRIGHTAAVIKEAERGPLPPLPLGGLTYRNGFVALASCAAVDWFAHGDAIVAAHPVTEVRLTTWPEPGDEDNHKWRTGKPRVGDSWTEAIFREWPSVKKWELPPIGSIRDHVRDRFLDAAERAIDRQMAARPIL